MDIKQTNNHINEYGLSVVRIFATDYNPSFAYSVGLKETYGHPEIICFGLKIGVLHQIINDVAEIIKIEGNIDAEKEYENIFKDSKAGFLKVDKRNIPDYFGAAINYYGNEDFECLQLIWTDRNNKFPWEKGFEIEFEYLQPLLDRNAEFQFRESTNLGVFTTKQMVEENHPIVRVVHEKDGDWQFLTEEIDFEDAKLVALGQVVQRDLTLNEVFDLEYGEEAVRNYIGDKWERKKLIE